MATSLSRRQVLRMGAGALGLAATGTALLGCGLAGSGAPTGGGGGGGGKVVFLSSQFAPTAEAEKLRRTLLSGAGREVDFIPAATSAQFVDRVTAEAQAGQGNVALLGGLQGEFVTLASRGLLSDLSGLVGELTDRKFTGEYLELAKVNGQTVFVPWVSASYLMAANKDALRYLPAGADVQKLTYEQLLAWLRAVQQGTGGQRFGLPASDKGLVKRFVQGYVYPSFTGGVNTTFRSPDAVAGWEWLRQAWATANPQSVTYGFMQEPLLSGEVLVAWDHAVRLIEALRGRPDQFVVFPAPQGPKGLGFLPVVGGLAIPKNSPDVDGAKQLIRHLTKPETTATTLRELAWFPPLEQADLPSDLPPGVASEAKAMQAMAGAENALTSSLAVGLGAQAGDYDKVFVDSFSAIVLQGKDIRATLDAQGKVLQDVLTKANAACWKPDPASQGVCQVA